VRLRALAAVTIAAATLGACVDRPSPFATPRGSAIAMAPTPQFGQGVDPMPSIAANPAPVAPGGAPGATAALDTIPQPGVQLKFEPWYVTDPMANDVVAMTWLAPDGWVAEGGVQWLHEWRVLAQLHTHVSDPTTGLAIEWLPLQNFIFFEPVAGLPPPPIGGNYQGKAYVPPPNDPLQFVADMWMSGPLAHLQGARVTKLDQVPAVADEFVRSYGGPATSNAFRIRYEFTTASGALWEEDVFFAWLFPAGDLPILWFVNFAYTVRAPAGMIDANAGIVSTVVSSRTTTPEWEGTYRLVNQLFTERIQQQLADTRAFGELLNQYRNESQALQAQVVAERQASQDRIAELRANTLAGVDNYVNPYDRSVVQLPSTWSSYWVNDKGEYIVSDTIGFDPNSVPNIGVWQQLQVRNP
jgi:hypothetical protein